jgi:hypothetical protein
VSRERILCVFAVYFCLISACFGETVYFLVAETSPSHGDSYVLPLTEPNDIAHARDLIKYGPGVGQAIVVARIACEPDCINRNYLAPAKLAWSWHVTGFENFADMTAEILDGWPGFVESDCEGWVSNTGGLIGFWDYTVVEELGTDPNHWNRDFDDDNGVDFFDYVPESNNWDNNCSSPSWCGGTDLDHSGKVDCNDLKIFADAWLSPYASLPGDCLSFPCWSWPYQCYGDADNLTQTPMKYRVYTSDYDILMLAYNTYYPSEGYNPCADFNRNYRVYDDDFAILAANWGKRDTMLQPPCPPKVALCPP